MGEMKRLAHRVAIGVAVLMFLAAIAYPRTELVLIAFIGATGLALGTYPSKQRQGPSYRLQQATNTWVSLQRRWNEECSSARFDALLANLKEIRTELDAIVMRRKIELDALGPGNVDQARVKFLSAYRISQMPSQQLTRSQRAALRSYGIATAADIDRDATIISKLVSRRAAAELLAWYRMHLRSFEPALVPPRDPRKVAAVEQHYDYMIERLARQLRDGTEALQDTSKQIAAARKRLEAPMQSAWSALNEAEEQG
jgi:hypothetical protein